MPKQNGIENLFFLDSENLIKYLTEIKILELQQLKKTNCCGFRPKQRDQNIEKGLENPNKAEH